MTSRARARHRADGAGRHCARHRLRHLLRDRGVEPLPVRVAGLAADRPQPDPALPLHAGPAHHHRHGRDPAAAGQAVVGLSAPVHPSAQEGQPRAGRRPDREGVDRRPRLGQRLPARRPVRSTSRSGTRGSSASAARTRRSPGSSSARCWCTSRSSCRSSATLSVRPLDPPHDEPSTRAADDEHAPTRRSVLLGASAASGLAVLLTAGQTVPFLRKVSVFGVRDGEGPQGLPVNRTAKAAGAAKSCSRPQLSGSRSSIGDTTHDVHP